MSFTSLLIAYPAVRKGLKIFAGAAATVALIAGGVWAFNNWKDGIREDGEKAGFAKAEAIYIAEVEAANRIIENDQKNVDRMALLFGALSSNRERDIQVSIAPISERVTHEVKSDPRYSNCRV